MQPSSSCWVLPHISVVQNLFLLSTTLTNFTFFLMNIIINLFPFVYIFIIYYLLSFVKHFFIFLRFGNCIRHTIFQRSYIVILRLRSTRCLTLTLYIHYIISLSACQVIIKRFENFEYSGLFKIVKGSMANFTLLLYRNLFCWIRLIKRKYG